MNKQNEQNENTQNGNDFIADVGRSFFVQWTENIKGEISEGFINRMSNDEFRLFIKCKLPEKYLRIMRDTLPYIGDEKRMMLLNQITLCRSLGRI